MNSELSVLTLTAIGIAFFHTILGPDHYIPFVALSKDRNWSTRKTTLITFFCGVGHVLSSVVLGLVGISFGIAVSTIQGFESFRGEIAGWLLTTFGLFYLIWGLQRAYKKKGHTHLFGKKHPHVHTDISNTKKQTNGSVWILFIIFVFGPCEPLIPIVMYPGMRDKWSEVVSVTIVFSIVTISTMVGLVLLLRHGVKLFQLKKLEVYSHAIAGLTILLCGLAIQMGL